ncbi:MAG TPA: 16S rRNA (uracil(1498)-N(3))-methyltransferase [Steroidobacteraceae bacterium]
MRLTRVYVDGDLRAGAVVELPRDTAAHLAKVLRVRGGEELVLFNGDGREFQGSIDNVRGARVSAAIGAAHYVDRESPCEVTLLQCVPRGDRMDFIVQKATELGVARIVPVLSQRSVVRLDQRQAESKQVHWHGVAVSACEQCGRNRLPRIETAQALLDYLGAPAPPGGAAAPGAAAPLRLVLDPGPAPEGWSEAAHIGNFSRPVRAVEVAIGPEGGFAPDELEAFRLSTFSRLTLGPRILRTETAAIAAVIMLQSRFGDMSAKPDNESRPADA